MSLTYSVEDEFLSTGIVDPHGSVVATTKQQVVDGAAATVWSGLSLFGEYGNPVTAKTADTGVLDYAWLGGKERVTDTSGLVLMGVRLYNSVTGHFTSVDPVKGGNTTRYTYPQDPINQYDLDGNAWNWRKTAKSVGNWAWKNKWDIALTAVSFVPGGALLRVGYGVAKGVRIYRAAKKASTAVGNLTHAKSASKLSISVAGRLWVKGGATVHKGGRHYRSADLTRQYRKVSYKPQQNKYQANLERWATPRKSNSNKGWNEHAGRSNYHVNWNGRRW